MPMWMNIGVKKRQNSPSANRTGSLAPKARSDSMSGAPIVPALKLRTANTTALTRMSLPDHVASQKRAPRGGATGVSGVVGCGPSFMRLPRSHHDEVGVRIVHLEIVGRAQLCIWRFGREEPYRRAAGGRVEEEHDLRDFRHRTLLAQD